MAAGFFAYTERDLGREGPAGRAGLSREGAGQEAIDKEWLEREMVEGAELDVPGNDDWSRVVTLQGVGGWIKRSRLRFGKGASDSAPRSGAPPAPTLGGGGDENSLGMKMVPVPGTKILMATTEVTVDQYKAADMGYESPGFAQKGDNPAVNVSWYDAKKYCEWLSRKEGRPYRLPSDHEWSCAVGLGGVESPKGTPESKDQKIVGVYPWGSGKPVSGAGNYMGQEWRENESGQMYAQAFGVGKEGKKWSLIPDYNDGCVFTARTASFHSNELGIFDLGGNVWEWCEDKFKPSSDGRVLRGGSWLDDDKGFLLSSFRGNGDPQTRNYTVGFRVVCEVR